MLSYDELVGPPIGADVAAFVGQEDDLDFRDRAGMAVSFVAAQARAYTRGRGWEKFDTEGLIPAEVAAVVVKRAARVVENPHNTDSQTIGSYTVNYGDGGWTLDELTTLNRYRRRLG